MNKVYIIYDIDKIYAHTIVKKYRDRFLFERQNPDFHSKTLRMCDMDFEYFLQKYAETQLIPITLQDDIGNCYDIIATVNENLGYKSTIVSYIADMEYAEKEFQKIQLKNKYRESLDYLLSYYDTHKSGLDVVRMNGYKIFMNIHSHTFDTQRKY